MDKYIKLSDLKDLIDKEIEEINKDFQEGKISISSHVAMLGTLEHLKKQY